MTHAPTPDWQRQAAKQRRRRMTPAEARLWQHLRAHRLQGHAFRRHAPIGPYIVDFVCQSHRLILAIDKDQRGTRATDDKRDAWFGAQGYRVLHLANRDVLTRLDAVLLDIVSALHHPPPHPSPQMGEGAALHEDDDL